MNKNIQINKSNHLPRNTAVRILFTLISQSKPNFFESLHHTLHHIHFLLVAKFDVFNLLQMSLRSILLLFNQLLQLAIFETKFPLHFFVFRSKSFLKLPKLLNLSFLLQELLISHLYTSLSYLAFFFKFLSSELKFILIDLDQFLLLSKLFVILFIGLQTKH
jgi:hypothetical protein